MIQPDGTAYFYSEFQPVSFCGHSFLYTVHKWNERTPAFCGLCFLADLLSDEMPPKIHEYKVLADNGKPEMKPRFVGHLETALGLVPPAPNQSLKQFRLARKQYTRPPSKNHTPATYGLWTLMGYQPQMAKPLLRLLVGCSEQAVMAEMNMSLYNLQVTVAKAIRTCLRYAR